MFITCIKQRKWQGIFNFLKKIKGILLLLICWWNFFRKESLWKWNKMFFKTQKQTFNEIKWTFDIRFLLLLLFGILLQFHFFSSVFCLLSSSSDDNDYEDGRTLVDCPIACFFSLESLKNVQIFNNSSKNS